MAKESENLIYLLALAKMKGVGAITARQLISYCGGAKNVFRAGYKKLIRIPGIGPHLVRTILNAATLKEAEKEVAYCQKNGIALYSYEHRHYPKRLLPLYDAPLVLYAEGNLDLNAKRTVGIVGTRKITDYGRDVTEQVVKELVPFSPLIVSGLAYGVDIAAHRSALKHGLSTVGVMASGITTIYPASHAGIARQMRQRGGLLTENSLNTPPDFQRFPARNRIIAGLSDAVIVIESAKKGGGLITVEFALNYHRDVYAVPGRLDQPLSEGCNQLIRNNKAALFSSVAELADDLRWNQFADARWSLFQEESNGITPVFEGFSTDESQLLALLRKLGNVQIDELHWQSGLPPGKVANLLLNLEFKGVVKSLPGKKYALVCTSS